MLASALAGKAQIAMALREWDAAEALLTEVHHGYSWSHHHAALVM